MMSLLFGALVAISTAANPVAELNVEHTQNLLDKWGLRPYLGKEVGIFAALVWIFSSYTIFCHLQFKKLGYDGSVLEELVRCWDKFEFHCEVVFIHFDCIAAPGVWNNSRIKLRGAGHVRFRTKTISICDACTLEKTCAKGEDIRGNYKPQSSLGSKGFVKIYSFFPCLSGILKQSLTFIIHSQARKKPRQKNWIRASSLVFNWKTTSPSYLLVRQSSIQHLFALHF